MHEVLETLQIGSLELFLACETVSHRIPVNFHAQAANVAKSSRAGAQVYAFFVVDADFSDRVRVHTIGASRGAKCC